MNMLNIIKEKYDNDNIGHFFIIEPGRVCDDTAEVTNWTEKLISELLETKNIINHEDYLEVCPSKSDSNYSLDDFKTFFSFLSYKATKSKRKIILIKEAEKLTALINNKLLKTLEEPPVPASIFLINNKKISLLETIVSRSIKIRVPVKSSQNQLTTERLSELKQLPIHKIIDKLKSNAKNEKQILNDVLTICTKSNVPYVLIEQIQNLINEYQEDKTYHNAATHRLFELANILKNLKLTT